MSDGLDEYGLPRGLAITRGLVESLLLEQHELQGRRGTEAEAALLGSTMRMASATLRAVGLLEQYVQRLHVATGLPPIELDVIDVAAEVKHKPDEA